MENVIVIFLENAVVVFLRNMEHFITTHPIETKLTIFGAVLPILVIVGCHIFDCLLDHWLVNHFIPVPDSDKQTFREYLKATSAEHQRWPEGSIRILAFFISLGVPIGLSTIPNNVLEVSGTFCVIYVLALIASILVAILVGDIKEERYISFEKTFPDRFQRYEQLYENTMNPGSDDMCDKDISPNVD